MVIGSRTGRLFAAQRGPAVLLRAPNVIITIAISVCAALWLLTTDGPWLGFAIGMLILLSLRAAPLKVVMGAAALILLPGRFSPSLSIWLQLATAAVCVLSLLFFEKHKKPSLLLFIVLYGGHVCFMTLAVVDASTPIGAQAHAIACIGMIAGITGIGLSRGGPLVGPLQRSGSSERGPRQSLAAEIWVPALALYGVGIAALIGTYIYIGQVPILDTTVDSLDSARIAALRGTGFIRYFAHLSMVVPQTVAALAIFRNDRRSFAVAASLLLVAGFLHTGFGFRSPLILAVIVPMVLWLFLGEKRLRPRKVAISMLAILGVLYFFGAYGTYRVGLPAHPDLWSVVSGMRGLFGWESAVNLYRIADTFPNRQPFALGSAYLRNVLMWTNPARAVGGLRRVDEMGIWLKEVTGSGPEGGGMSPTIAGEAYLNFGITGVAVVLLLFGCLWDCCVRLAWDPLGKHGEPARLVGMHVCLYSLGSIRVGIMTGIPALGFALFSVWFLSRTLKKYSEDIDLIGSTEGAPR
jgi:hypothetical protein